MLKNKGGFTLIELIMIIVILGILAAVAIPRFADLQADARKATVDSMGGSLRSTAGIVHAKALIDGKTTDCAGATSVTIEGQTINLCYGYPDADYIDNALQDYSGFTFNLSGSTGTFNKTGYTNDCSVGYTEPGAANNAPTYNVVKTGC